MSLNGFNENPNLERAPFWPLFKTPPYVKPEKGGQNVLPGLEAGLIYLECGF